MVTFIVSKIFSQTCGGNYLWNLYIGENKNQNSIVIHDNNMGKTIFKNDEIKDIDLFKAVRVLNEYRFERIDLKDLIKKINKECRHLEIPTYITL